MEKTIRTTRQLVIDQMLDGVQLTGRDVLEPSAGSGNLADGILKASPFVQSLDCIELNQELREELIRKGYTVVGKDFLKFQTEKKYDYIIATPTYKNNVDIEHIMHMFNFLKPDGKIVALTYPEWTMKNGEHQVRFRKWLETKNYSMKMLKDNSFVENYKTQPSVIITIRKGTFKYGKYD